MSAADTRRRLLDAAGSAFAERGFHATTTRDIAAAAGMSPAAVYVHHESKEDLLYLLSLEGHRATDDLVRDAIASSDDPADQLTAVVAAFCAFHVEQHVLARVVNYELKALADDHAQEIWTLRRTIQRRVQEVVEAGVAAHQFHTGSPAMTTMAVLSLCVDIARWYNRDAMWPPDELAAFYCDLALRMVGA
jgi:AcrR family transcriptional regulator